MYAAKEAGYAPLDNLYFDTHGDAINRAQAAIRQVRDPQGKGVPLSIPSDVNSILTDTNGLANPEVTGRTIQQASRDLRATGDWTGHRYADALDNTLRYDTPSDGGQAGEAWDAKQAGDLWYQRINDLERLGDQPTMADVTKTQGFYSDPQSPEAQSLARLKSAMQSSFNPWHLRHVVGPVIGGGMGAVEDYLNPEDHHNPWLNKLDHAPSRERRCLAGCRGSPVPGRRARSIRRVIRSAQGNLTRIPQTLGRSATGCGRSSSARRPVGSSPRGGGTRNPDRGWRAPPPVPRRTPDQPAPSRISRRRFCRPPSRMSRARAPLQPAYPDAHPDNADEQAQKSKQVHFNISFRRLVSLTTIKVSLALAGRIYAFLGRRR